MKTTMVLLSAILLLSSLQGALAQHEGMPGMGHSGSVGPSNDSARLFMMMANDEQRSAFAKCMEAIEQVRVSLSQMGEIGSPWSRGRKSYDNESLRTLAAQEKQLDSALKAMGEAHQFFWQRLSEAQKSALERQLRKLDQVQSEIDSAALEINQLVMDAKPGPASAKIQWEINALGKNVGKWHSEHRKIANEMAISL